MKPLRPPIMSRTTNPTRQTPVARHVNQDHASRRDMYRDRRWHRLRWKMLTSIDAPCAVCGQPATVLDHLVGHTDSQALKVATHLGLAIEPSWQARFYTGPFVTLCQQHHNQKTQQEMNGRLLDWVRSLQGRAVR